MGDENELEVTFNLFDNSVLETLKDCVKETMNIIPTSEVYNPNISLSKN